MRCELAELFQSTLPAWGETDRKHGPAAFQPISIHSPRMGRDPAHCSAGRQRRDFNPLSPHGERLDAHSCSVIGQYFNPLSPHGERPCTRLIIIIISLFQSTLPAWGETSATVNRLNPF